MVERFLRTLFRKGILPSANLRKELVFTTKIKAVLFLTIFLQIFWASFITFVVTYKSSGTFLFTIFLWLTILLLLIANSYICIIQAQDILFLPEYFLKQREILKAKKKILQLREKGLKIIGITGSYGKTTMKETIYNFLSVKFNVVKTEGNNNTPLGVAATVNKNLKHDTEFLIIEMGEYVKGDVKKLCEIAKPDISIITGINEAHLERYKTMQNAIDTKFEIIENANPNALIILNEDDKLIMHNYNRFVKDTNVVKFFSSEDKDNRIDNYSFFEDGSGISFNLRIESFEFKNLKLPFLADYVIGYVIAGILLGKTLGMNATELRMGISNLKPFEHRLQSRLTKNNVVIIDDTYNGNSHGIKAGLEVLKKFKTRRKLYITPGLVETGGLAEEIHIELGKAMGQVCDLIILIQNNVTKFIEQGLLESGFNPKNIIWYNSAQEAYSNLKMHIKSGDVVLMQNDWSDNYY